MTTDEEERFSALKRKLGGRTTLRLIVTADERSSAFEVFCEKLAALVPQVSVIREEALEQAYPFLLLPNGVRYQGIPCGREVEPFVDALAGTTPTPKSLLANIEAVRRDAAVDLYVMPQCAHCPTAVRQLVSLAEASRFIQLTIIDGAFFPELAERHRIRAVPTAILDSQFRWTGRIDLPDVVAWLATRDPLSLGPESLEMMLKDGSAQRIAEMMMDCDRILPAFMELLCHEEWPVRLGAMVTLEQLAGLNSDLAQEALRRLWDRYAISSDRVRGDIVFLSGELGGPWVIPNVNRLLGAVDSELKEAVVEALAKLRERGIHP